MKQNLFIGVIIFLSLVSNANSSADSVFVKRDFLIFKDKIEITLSIHKPKAQGFARIYERLPEGAHVNSVQSGAGYYKSEKSMLKIAWDDIPSDTIVKVIYTVKINISLEDTLSAFQGTFSSEFMSVENETIKIISGAKNYFHEPVLVVNTTKEEKKKTDEKKVNVTTNSVNTNSKNEAVITSDKSTYICIQVAAVGSNVSSDYLMKKFNYPGEFDTHFEGKFYRITIGKYQSTNEAQIAMNELKSKYFQKCFLSAYRNGEKIAVYEAEKLLK